jgi:hypothetical protein
MASPRPRIFPSSPQIDAYTRTRSPLLRARDLFDRSDMRPPVAMLISHTPRLLPFCHSLERPQGSTEHPLTSFSWHRRWSSARKDGKHPFLFVFHFAIDPQHLVLVFELDEAAVSGEAAQSGFAVAWSRFLQGDDGLSFTKT